MSKKLLLTITVVLFFCFFTFSQTLVNLEQVDTLGQPTIVLDLFVVDKDHDTENGIVVAVMNRYVTGEEESFYIFAYQSNGSTMLWDAEFNSLTNARDFGTDVFIKNDFVYVTDFSWDSAANTAEWNTMKLDLQGAVCIIGQFRTKASIAA